MKFRPLNATDYLDGLVTDIPLSPSDKPTYAVTLADQSIHQLTESELEACIPPPPPPPDLPPARLPGWLSPGSKVTYEKDGQYHHLYVS